METHATLLQQLWQNVGELTPTTHEQILQEDLDPSANQVISGGIGSGKTFAVRQYLHSKEIPHHYCTAHELLMYGQESVPELSDIDTIVVDNFDTIPPRRDPLDDIHRVIELELESFDRGVWLILPESFSNQWFNSVLGTYERVTIDVYDIDNFDTSQVRHNIDSVITSDSTDDSTNEETVSTIGYHAVVKSFY